MNVAPAAPIVVLAGRTIDPENVGAELLRLLCGNGAAVRKGIRMTDEVPPRDAIPDTIEMLAACRCNPTVSASAILKCSRKSSTVSANLMKVGYQTGTPP